MADHDDAFDTQLIENGNDVTSQRVKGIARRRPTRGAVPAASQCENPVAIRESVGEGIEHVSCISTARQQQDRWPAASPIKNFYVDAWSHSDKRHAVA